MFNFAFLLDTTETQPTGDVWTTYIFYGILIVAMIVMFVMSSRSKKKRDQEIAEMRDGLAIGDEVTTIGGIIGKVVSIKGETFVLETTKDRTKIRFLKAAINTIDVKAADIANQVIDSKDDDSQDEQTKSSEATEE